MLSARARPGGGDRLVSGPNRHDREEVIGAMRGVRLPREVTDTAAYERAVRRFRNARIVLPTFAELADPGAMPAWARRHLAQIGPDDPDPTNLFRVHWFNRADRRSIVDVPQHEVLPAELTGRRAHPPAGGGDDPAPVAPDRDGELDRGHNRRAFHGRILCPRARDSRPHAVGGLRRRALRGHFRLLPGQTARPTISP